MLLGNGFENEKDRISGVPDWELTRLLAALVLRLLTALAPNDCDANDAMPSLPELWTARRSALRFIRTSDRRTSPGNSDGKSPLRSLSLRL